jgi:hypothetical protein
MRLNRWVGFVVLLLGVMTVWGPTSPGQAPAPQQQQQVAWEYKFVEVSPFPIDFEKPFHELGRA